MFSLKKALLIFAILSLCCESEATLFFTDHFNYTDGANLGSTTGGGGANWSLSSGDVSQIKISSSATLTSPDGFAAGDGLGIAVIPTGSRKQTGVPINGTTGIPVVNGNVIYASFLLNVRTLPSGNMRVAYMHSGASTQGGIEVVVSSTGQVGIQKKGSGTTFVSGTPVANPGTHLVVMRYTFQSGNDQVAVWVDPDSSSYGAELAPTEGQFASTVGGGSDMSVAITYFIIESAAVTGPVFWIDEVRLASTWQEAVPSGAFVPQTSPIITECKLASEGVILRGNNGPFDGVYQVLASTNFTLPLSNWSNIGAHAFDSNGHFDSTNPVVFNAAQQFFRLLVGGTIPVLPTAPAITNQLRNLIVSAGRSTNFLVGATGTAPLTYQWFFNTNTPVGGNSSSLSLLNVQAFNAGSYYVVVSNSIGSVTSAVATLTVVPASPFVITQPQNQSVVASNTATFVVAAGGTEPLNYQWYLGPDTILTDETNSSLAIQNAQTNDIGDYFVIIGNSEGSITSAVATLTVVGLPDDGGNIFVATNGLDANPGTIDQPTTLTKAITLVQPGGTIFMRGGVYAYSTQITIERTNSGFGELRKNIFAYPGEHPILDFSSQPYGKTSSVSNPRGVQINGHCWHLRGLEVEGSADNGIYVAGNSNIVEQCIVHNNRDSGLQLGRYSSSVGHSEWPAYNLILNCDSYDNFDAPPNSGENADGFACKLTTGPGNVFRGCVSHNNIDDGWDLFTKTDTGAIDPVTIDQCISYSNGTLTDGTSSDSGDRNGFKLGGSDIAVNHIVTRCIAFNNGKNGFTWNSNPGQIRLVNNFAFNNVQGNYKFDQAGPIFINNLTLWTSGSGVNDRYGGSSGIATGTNNVFWFNGHPKNDAGLTVSVASFQSLTVPPGGFVRNADGSLNLGNFAKLASNSPLIGAGGVPVLPNPNELPFDPATYYIGNPDIGAVESGQ